MTVRRICLSPTWIRKNSLSIAISRTRPFADVALVQSIAQATRLLSGWGLKFFDYDNDGNLDLILANGHPDDMVGQRSQGVKYREPILLFHQQNGRFQNVSADAGPAFTRRLRGSRPGRRRFQ